MAEQNGNLVCGRVRCHKVQEPVSIQRRLDKRSGSASVAGQGTDLLAFNLPRPSPSSTLLLRDGASIAVPSPDGSRKAWTTANGCETWVGDGSAAGARRLLAGSSHNTFPVMLWSANGKTDLAKRRTLVVPLAHSADVPEENEPGFHTDDVAVNAETGHLYRCL